MEQPTRMNIRQLPNLSPNGIKWRASLWASLKTSCRTLTWLCVLILASYIAILCWKTCLPPGFKTSQILQLGSPHSEMLLRPSRWWSPWEHWMIALLVFPRHQTLRRTIPEEVIMLFLLFVLSSSLGPQPKGRIHSFAHSTNMYQDLITHLPSYQRVLRWLCKYKSASFALWGDDRKQRSSPPVIQEWLSCMFFWT